MSDPFRVSHVGFVAGSDADRARGLLFFVSFRVGLLIVDGVALRRTRGGRLTLSYPARHDARGVQHAIVRPIDDTARVAIEAQVFAALHLEREAAP
jgi:hypothetical protein